MTRDSAMGLLLFDGQLKGYTQNELELIRFEYLFGVGTLTGRKVTVPKFRPDGDVRDSAVYARHDIERMLVV
jgi:hypothetical protein